MGDQSVTAANVRTSKSTPDFRWIANLAITAGQVLARDSTTGNAILADANGSTDAKVVKGVSVNSAAAGQFVDGVNLDPALVPGFAVTAGVIYILSGTAGSFGLAADQASGWKNTFLGIGNDDGTINFNPVAGGSTA